MCCAMSLPMTGAIMKPCPMKPELWIEVVDFVDLADDGILIRGEVVTAGPLPEHLDVPEDGAARDERLRVERQGSAAMTSHVDARRRRRSLEMPPTISPRVDCEK